MASANLTGGDGGNYAQTLADNCHATLSWTQTAGTAGVVDEATNSNPETPGPCFRYDPAGHQFIYHLGTKGFASKSNYRISLSFSGGPTTMVHEVIIGIR